jgi:hypothetical protein
MHGVLIGLLLWVLPNLIFLALLLRANGNGSSLDKPERRLPQGVVWPREAVARGRYCGNFGNQAPAIGNTPAGKKPF